MTTTEGLRTILTSPTTGQNSLKKKTTYIGAKFFNARPEVDSVVLFCTHFICNLRD